jgi:hypothetical protein
MCIHTEADPAEAALPVTGQNLVSASQFYTIIKPLSSVIDYYQASKYIALASRLR